MPKLPLIWVDEEAGLSYLYYMTSGPFEPIIFKDVALAKVERVGPAEWWARMLLNNDHVTTHPTLELAKTHIDVYQRTYDIDNIWYDAAVLYGDWDQFHNDNVEVSRRFWKKYDTAIAVNRGDNSEVSIMSFVPGTKY